MSEGLSCKRALQTIEFDRLLVCTIYTSGDMFYFERDYDPKSIHCTELEEVGNMSFSDAKKRIGLFNDDGLSSPWLKIKTAFEFYRLQQEHSCFVLVLHDGNE